MHQARSFQHSRSAEPVKGKPFGCFAPLTEPALLPLGFPPGLVHMRCPEGKSTHYVYTMYTYYSSTCPSLCSKECHNLMLGSEFFKWHLRLLKNHDPLRVPTDRTHQLGAFILFFRSYFSVPAPPRLHQACPLEHLVVLVCIPRY